MESFAELSCKFNEKGDISPRTLERLGIAYSDIYASAEHIVAISLATKEENQAQVAVLPFCHTVEAKALGADICPGDETAGPRPGHYTCTKLDDLRICSLLDDPEIQRLLQACRLLKEQGETVCYLINGPISILSCLMNLALVFKTWRKDPERLKDLFAQMNASLLEYLEAVRDAGADIIFFADPAGSPSILGPAYTTFMAQEALTPFLQQALACCQGQQLLATCPLIMAALTHCQLAAKAAGQDGDLVCVCMKHMPSKPVKVMKLF